MTPQKEHEDGKEGILEQMLRWLMSIGQNVERMVCRLDFYNTGAGRRNDDEWSPDELYNNENGDY
jgi:hypothetical protein